MIKHVVLMRFNPGVTDREIEAFMEGLRQLPEMIPEIREYAFGRDVVGSERSFDFALVSAFDDLEALERYRVHPAHVAVLGILRGILAASWVVDFTW